MRRTMLPYGRQSISDADVRAVEDVLRSDWLTTGPTIERFESAVAARLGAAHVVAVNSGTAALHAAYAAAGVGPGDEVIMPSLTFAATANAAVYLGARPVFAEIDEHTFMLDPRSAADAIGPRTRAIVTVHYAGAAADVAALRAAAEPRGIIIIEDAAHAFGAVGSDGPIGARSALAAFSFHPVKIITTGEGGAVATSDPDRARTMRIFRNHGITSEARERERARSWHYEMVMLGFNYRLTDIGAALGLAQLGRVDAFLARRRAIAARYTSGLRGHDAIHLQETAIEASAWHIFPIALRTERLSIDRDEFVGALRMEGIGANVHYDPVHLHPFYRASLGCTPGILPITERVAGSLVTLPIHPGMRDSDVDDVLTAVTRVADWYARSRTTA